MIVRSFGDLRVMFGPAIEQMAQTFKDIDRVKRDLKEKDKGDDRHHWKGP